MYYLCSVFKKLLSFNNYKVIKHKNDYMKQVYTIILSVLLGSTYALANVQTPQRLGVTDESILAKVQECEETRNSNYPVHYCACTHAHQELEVLPLDIAVSDSLWFRGKVTTFGTGVTAYIYGETGVHIDLYLNCRAKGPISAGTFVGSVDVEPNNIWDIDEATIAAKLKEAGISSAVYMCIYPLEEGSEARLFCNPYNAASYGYIDDIIEPRNTRFRIIRALEQLADKKASNPWKKHDNLPL
jgi:hypothetical protein